jgi:hypothetical protein
MVGGLAGANLADVGPVDLKIASGARSFGPALFETIAPTTPCYRRGVVLQALSTSQAGRRPIHRNAFQARELGMSLVGRKDDIDAGVRDALKAASEKLKIRCHSVKLLDDDVMSRFAPGLILDFPAHEFQLGRLVVRERTCVTVCYNEAASKIWVRFIVSNVEGSKINAADLSRFFRFCNEASRIARERTEAIYLEEFRSNYPGRNQVEFEELGAVDFIGVDTLALEFDEFLNTDEIGPVMGSDRIPADKQDLFSSFYLENIDSFMPKRFTKEEKSCISRGYIAAFRSEFEYRALYHGIFREKDVTFLVMGEPGQYVEAFKRPESGALTIISELAARAVGNF